MPTPTQDGQISVNGLLLGAGTTYDVVAFNPYQRAVRHNQTDRAWTDGAWSGRELTAATASPLRVHIVTDTTAAWVAAQQSLTAALRRTTSDVELRWRLGGTEYLMFVRPRLVEPDPSTSGYGHGPVTCALMALDPRIYSADQQQQQLGLPSAAGGLWFLWYWSRHADKWDWISELPLILLVSVATASFAWTFDYIVLLPAVIQCAVWTARSKKPQRRLVIGIHLALGAVLLVAKVFIRNDFWYFWVAPAFVFFYLYVRANVGVDVSEQK